MYQQMQDVPEAEVPVYPNRQPAEQVRPYPDVHLTADLLFVKVFLHAVNDDFIVAPEDRHITHG